MATCRSGFGSCKCYGGGTPGTRPYESTADWITRNQRVPGRGWFVLIWRIQAVTNDDGSKRGFWVRKATGSSDPAPLGDGGMNIYTPNARDYFSDIFDNARYEFAAIGDSIARFWLTDTVRLTAQSEALCRMVAEVVAEPAIPEGLFPQTSKTHIRLDTGNRAGGPRKFTFEIGTEQFKRFEYDDVVLHSSAFLNRQGGSPSAAGFRAWPHITSANPPSDGTITLRVWYDGPFGATVSIHDPVFNP